MDNSKIKILVVDDEEDITFFTAKMLEYSGFTVLKAVDGGQALEIFEKEHPHICILDAHLGYSKITGMEVLEKMREKDNNIEVIMITRVTDPNTVNRAKELGVKEYFLKPLATAEWVENVKTAAGRIWERDFPNG